MDISKSKSGPAGGRQVGERGASVPRSSEGRWRVTFQRRADGVMPEACHRQRDAPLDRLLTGGLSCYPGLSELPLTQDNPGACIAAGGANTAEGLLYVTANRVLPILIPHPSPQRLATTPRVMRNGESIAEMNSAGISLAERNFRRTLPAAINHALSSVIPMVVAEPREKSVGSQLGLSTKNDGERRELTAPIQPPRPSW